MGNGTSSILDAFFIIARIEMFGQSVLCSDYNDRGTIVVLCFRFVLASDNLFITAHKMSKESKNNILKYFSSTASTSPQAIKKLKLDDNVIQNNEISLPSTSSQIPASDLLDNTKNLFLLLKHEKIFLTTQENRNLRFQINWTYEFYWLCYSKIQDGAFCLTCILFPPSDELGKGGHQNPGKLVVEKYNNWKKAKDLFKDHQNNHYHKLEISLRGHRDSEVIDLNEHSSTENQGNFRELIKFRIDSGDNVLKNHLETTNKNATYLSPLIQNEIISICNKLNLEHLVANVNKSKSFTILADETTDVSNKEQITLCVRYVDLNANKIGEDFLQFIEIQNMSGKGLSDVILKSMTDFGLNIKYLLGKVEIFPQTNRFKLKNLSATRWVDRHDAVILFEELQLAILHALDKITLWPDSDTSNSASHLLTAIRQLNFQTALVILVKILSISFPLSRYLQIVNLDLKTALEAASNVQNTIQEIRENCNIEMKISEEIKGKFIQLVETYQDIVDECTDSNLNDNLLNGELDLWYTKYSTLTSAELKNKNAIEIYFQTCPDVYPIISKLLQIFMTLPVSTAMGERSFSTLRRLKTYLRNSSGQIRLNGLALLNIHRDINVDINDVLDELAKNRNEN
ncbi:hypothetical protein QTP88_026374 [Uroleucon formosanum]